MLLYYRYGTIFRQIVDSKENDWCSFMDGKETFPLIRMITVHLNKTVPHLLHKCPYTEFDIFNLSLTDTKTPKRETFPQGYYKVVITWSKNNRTIFTLKLKGEVTSSFKESYG